MFVEPVAMRSPQLPLSFLDQSCVYIMEDFTRYAPTAPWSSTVQGSRAAGMGAKLVADVRRAPRPYIDYIDALPFGPST